MVKIGKLDAFSLVVEAADSGDEKTANEIMKIIMKSINKDKRNNSFSTEIEVNGKKEERFLKRLLSN